MDARFAAVLLASVCGFGDGLSLSKTPGLPDKSLDRTRSNSRTQSSIAKMTIGERWLLDEFNILELINKTSSNEVKQNRGRILIVYTTHGESRHLDSLCLNVALLQRQGVPEMLKTADVLVFDNAGTDVDSVFSLSNRSLARKHKPHTLNSTIASPQARRDRVKQCVANFHAGSTSMYMTSENIGYTMGAVQAVDTLLNHNLLEDYDWVVHLHPDIFIVRPQPLYQKLSEHTDAAVVAGAFFTHHASYCPGYRDCWTFNFFAFKPDEISKDAFSGWKHYESVPERFLGEIAFHDVKVDTVPHSSMRQLHNEGIDDFGMWHQHATEYVHKYFKKHPKVE